MPDQGEQTAFYASRPTIKLDGQKNDALGDSLLSIFVEEKTLGLARCEAHFANWGPKNNSVDFLFFDRQTIDFGKDFAVEMGPPDASAEIFKGRIAGLEAQYPSQRDAELTVLAEDRFQDLRMERRTRSFENMSDSDVISQIASQHGLTAQVDANGPTYRVLTQLNQSDLAFLRERAAAIDAELWMDDRTLHVQAHTSRNGGTVDLHYSREGQNLLEFSVLADLAHQRTSVRVSGWDVSGKDKFDEEATDNVVSGELNGDRGGSSILGQALAQRKERIVSAVPMSQQEAQSMAKARYRERARRFLTGKGIANGNPLIRVGATLNITGVGPMFDGKYYVTLARHSFDSHFGYQTKFETSRPGIGG
jgi:Bacteriophage probable baseplate hub protein